jgi:hypothetical protein
LLTTVVLARAAGAEAFPVWVAVGGGEHALAPKRTIVIAIVVKLPSAIVFKVIVCSSFVSRSLSIALLLFVVGVMVGVAASLHALRSGAVCDRTKGSEDA